MSDKYYCPQLKITDRDSDREKSILKAEIERLREAIKNAPHGRQCNLARWMSGLRTPNTDGCDCWKSKALEALRSSGS